MKTKRKTTKGPAPRYTPATIARHVEAIADRKRTVTETADELEVSYALVYRWCVNAGIDLTEIRKARPPSDRVTAMALLASKRGDGFAAKRYGVSRPYVQKMRTRLGLPACTIRGPDGVAEEAKAKAVARLEKAAEKVAATVGVDGDSVLRWHRSKVKRTRRGNT